MRSLKSTRDPRKLLKKIEFHERITKIIKHIRIPYENHENHDKLRISQENHENYEILEFQLRIKQIMKTLEFYLIISKSRKS